MYYTYTTEKINEIKESMDKNELSKKLDEIKETFIKGDFKVSADIDKKTDLWHRVTEVDNDSETIVSYDMPGATKDSIALDIEDNELKAEGGSDKRKYYYKKVLTSNIDHDNITASYENGVLTVKLPKLKETQKSHKKIVIN